jgi:hypothetical protein
MAKRRGAGKGTGKGYKNLPRFPKDPVVHSQSARGIKQPQDVSPRVKSLLEKKPELKDKSFKQLQKEGVFLKYQADSDGDGVPNIKDCKPLDQTKQDDDMSEMMEMQPKTKSEEKIGKIFYYKSGLLSGSVFARNKEEAKFKISQRAFYSPEDKLIISEEQIPETSVGRFLKKTLEIGKRKLEDIKKERDEQRIEELGSVSHPKVRQFEKQHERVKTAEKHYELAQEPERKERLYKELKEEQRQLREIHEEVTQIRIEDLSDSKLRTLAIRHKGKFSLIGSGNPYKDELLRRDRFREELKKEEKEVVRKAKEPRKSVFEDMF